MEKDDNHFWVFVVRNVERAGVSVSEGAVSDDLLDRVEAVKIVFAAKRKGTRAFNCVNKVFVAVLSFVVAQKR